jgi:protein-tyrosine phosphatase
MIDIHSHILYGILDSPTNIEGSLEIAKQYVRSGFTHIVSTPHFNSSKDDIETFVLNCSNKYNQLNELLYKENISLSIIPGAEVMLSPDIIRMPNIDKLCIDKSEYMLIEFPWEYFPTWIKDVLFELGLKSITPILAHPERNRWIIENYKKFSELIDAGLLTQINAINLLKGGQYKKTISHLIKNNAVTFIASDAHLPDERLTRFNEAISVMKKRYGILVSEKIIDNSSLVIKNSLLKN